MPKAIRHQIKSTKPLYLKSMLAILGVFLLVVGLWFTFRPKQADIFMIDGPAPLPSGSPIGMCNQQVASLTFTEACGAGMYRYVKNMLCSGTTSTGNLGGADQCKDMATWYSEALAICQQKFCSSPKPSPVACSTTVLKYRESCDTLTRSFRYVDYTCFTGDKVRSQGSSSSCKTSTVWKQNAQMDCAKVCLPPTPTPAASYSPRPSMTPTPTPKPTAYP